jgi:hypothetical protein
MLQLHELEKESIHIIHTERRATSTVHAIHCRPVTVTDSQYPCPPAILYTQTL